MSKPLKKILYTLSLIAVAAFLTGCGTTLKKVSLNEAFSYEHSLAARGNPILEEPQELYVQPVNKKEPCKLLTSQDQLDRNNFRAYWDGQCKNGFAYGLGRDIALSDTHHAEEITIYRDNGKTTNSPAITYDFVNNLITYRLIGNKPYAGTFFSEQIENTQGNFNTSYSLGQIDEMGNAKIIYWSPFSSQQTLVNIHGDIVNRYQIDNFAGSINPTALVFIADVLDKRSKQPGNFSIIKYANGQVRHIKANHTEPVVLPEEYTANTLKKYQEIIITQPEMSRNIEKAKQLEREYLHMACNGKHRIENIDRSTSNKICTWRNQFQEPFKIAQEKYVHHLERLKSEARTIEAQRRAQEELDNQRRLVRAAENANIQQVLNRNKVTNCYTNFGMTTCY